MTQTTSADETLARLKDEFPRWSIIYTQDTCRWWANRGPLCDEHGRSCIDADTADGLREKLRKLDS